MCQESYIQLLELIKIQSLNISVLQTLHLIPSPSPLATGLRSYRLIVLLYYMYIYVYLAKKDSLTIRGSSSTCHISEVVISEHTEPLKSTQPQQKDKYSGHLYINSKVKLMIDFNFKSLGTFPQFSCILKGTYSSLGK